MNKVLNETKDGYLNPKELNVAFNAIYKNPRHKVNFTDREMNERIDGVLCACEGNGVFELLSVEKCLEGGKRYMKCTVCGEHSHL